MVLDLPSGYTTSWICNGVYAGHVLLLLLNAVLRPLVHRNLACDPARAISVTGLFIVVTHMWASCSSCAVMTGSQSGEKLRCRRSLFVRQTFVFMIDIVFL